MSPARAVIFIICLLLGTSAAWSNDENQQKLRQLDETVQQIKQSVLLLERDLNAYQNTTAYPPSQQLRVFLTMEVFDFELDSVSIQSNGTELANHQYSSREVYALRKGGVQELFLGNVSPGVHQLTAKFHGRFSDAGKAPYSKSIEVSFRKGSDPQWLELRIDRSSGHQLDIRAFEREASQ